MIDTSKLTDIELNRAMLWCYPIKGETVYNGAVDMYMTRYRLMDYLSSWDLTMPLAVEHRIWLQPAQATPNGWFAYDDDDHHSTMNGNPLRAICCVLVQIAMDGE